MIGKERESCHDIDHAPNPQESGTSLEEGKTVVPRRKTPPRPWHTFLAILAIFSFVLVGVSLIAYSLTSSSADSVILSDGATVYYNSACGDCVTYIQDVLIPVLNANGAPAISLKDWTNHQSYREELYSLNKQNDIDTSLMSHLTTFLKTDRLIVFEGHVPGELVAQVVQLNMTDIPRMVVSVWDDGMADGMPQRYAAWAYTGAPQTYDISTPPSAYIEWLKGQSSGLWNPDTPTSMLPLVILAGFIDGLNPCAFAVLLFFISLLFATRSPAVETAKMGAVYIYAIFLVYLMIGLGLLGAIVLSPEPHFMAKVGAVMMVIVAIITIANYFLPKIPMPFHMPKSTWAMTRRWMMKATLPGAAVAGLLVGLCTFPCSGTIYVFVLGLLASKTTFITGLGYLYLYNIFFVLPLILTLAGMMVVQYVFKKPVARRFAQWERIHSAEFRLAGALVMIAISVVFFLWSTSAM